MPTTDTPPRYDGQLYEVEFHLRINTLATVRRTVVPDAFPIVDFMRRTDGCYAFCEPVPAYPGATENVTYLIDRAHVGMVTVTPLDPASSFYYNDPALYTAPDDNDDDDDDDD